MPMYEYYCGKCGKEWLNVHSMSNRNEEVCECGELAKIHIVPPGVRVFNQLTLFDLDPSGPVTVNSSVELKAECNKRGVTYIGPGRNVRRRGER